MRQQHCLALLLAVAGAAPAVGAAESVLDVEWREGPEYPMGIQDSACAVLDGKLISAGGFTRHPKDIVSLYPDAFGGEKNGFTKLAFLFDPGRPEAGWVRIPDIPGPARQGAAAVVVGDAFYAIGGFSYTEPHSYRSVYRLRKVAGAWAWDALPCDLPWPACEASAVAIGTRIYLVGAADFLIPPGAKEVDFHTEAGRDGSPVGRALLVLDTRNLDAGWKRLADLPGTPRFDCACGAAGGKLYVLGGIYAPLRKTGPDAYFNVVDSWEYDPKTDRWSRVPDMPHGANRRAVAYRDRYLLLLAGYRYPKTQQLDGAVSEVYTAEEKAKPWQAFFENTVLAYDTRTRRLGPVAPLLDKTSWPGAAVLGDTVFCLGGEGGARLWHPATLQIGKIKERRRGTME